MGWPCTHKAVQFMPSQAYCDSLYALALTCVCEYSSLGFQIENVSHCGSRHSAAVALEELGHTEEDHHRLALSAATLQGANTIVSTCGRNHSTFQYRRRNFSEASIITHPLLQVLA